MKTETLSAEAAQGSRVGDWCARGIEACWLVAIGIVPLLYNPHAFNGFDSFKMAGLQALGILILAGLFTQAADKLLPSRAAGAAAAREIPSWGIALIAVLLSAAISTALSVDPRESFQGSPHWRQGTLSLIAQIALFLGIATNLRSRSQVNRLATTALAASLPVAIYALLQRAGLDPSIFPESPDLAISFAGHPIFLAGYLLMLMPLTVWKLSQSLRSDSRPPNRIRPTLFAGLLLLQFAALLSTEKRGPIVSLALEGAAALLLLAAMRRQFRIARWGIAVAIALSVFLLGAAILGKQGTISPSTPLLGRLSMVIPIGTGTGDVYRASIWANGPVMALGAKPLVFPDGTVDRWKALRTIFGYGPATLAGVLPFYWLCLPNGPNLFTEGQFHSHFWGTAQSTGAVGVAAFWGFMAAIFLAGCRSLGLLREPRAGVRLGLAAFGAAIAAGIALSLIYGWGYFGLGFQAGFAGGMILWTVRSAFGTKTPVLPPTPALSYQWLGLAVLAALIGNQIDAAFAFPTGNTSTVFWVFSGLIVALVRFDRAPANDIPASEDEASGDPGSVEALRKATWLSSGIFAGLLSGGMLIAILHGFVSLQSQDSFTALDVLRATLTQVHLGEGPSYVIPLLLLPTSLGVNFCLLDGLRPKWDRGSWRALIAASGVSLFLAAAFAFLKALWLQKIGPLPGASAPVSEALVQGQSFASLGLTLWLLFGLLLLGLATTLRAWPASLRPRPASGWVTACCIFAALAASTVLWQTSARIVRAEAFSKWGCVLLAQKRDALATAVYRKALEIEPRNVLDRIACARAWRHLAENAKTPAAFFADEEEGTKVLRAAADLSPLNFAAYHLGGMYLRMGLRATDPQARLAFAALAKDAFQRTTVFAPQAAAAWFDASIVDRELLLDSHSADSNLQRADALAQTLDATPWAEYYARHADDEAETTIRNYYARRAVACFERVVQQNREWKQRARSDEERKQLQEDTFRSLISEGTLLKNLKENELAVNCWFQAEREGAPDETWEAWALIAQLTAPRGHPADTRHYMAKAINGAPASVVPDLQRLQAALVHPMETPPN